MVKSFTIAAASCVLLLSACSRGNGTLQGCATALDGTYEGDTEGFIYAFLTLEGESEVRFLDPDDTPEDLQDNTFRPVTIMVDDQGVVTTTSTGALQVTGTMDLDSCVITGEWDLFGGNTVGTWTIGPYNTGL